MILDFRENAGGPRVCQGVEIREARTKTREFGDAAPEKPPQPPFFLHRPSMLASVVSALLVGSSVALTAPNACRPTTRRAVRVGRASAVMHLEQITAETLLQASSFLLSSYMLMQATRRHEDIDASEQQVELEQVYEYEEEETWYLSWEEQWTLSWDGGEDDDVTSDVPALAASEFSGSTSDDVIEPDESGVILQPARSHARLGCVPELEAAVARAVELDEMEEAARLTAELRRLAAVCESLERRFRDA